MTDKVEAYWVESPGQGGIRAVETAPPRAGFRSGKTLFSGVSPGTERAVGRGHIDPDNDGPMACRYMEGSFALPVKYGYSLVGELAGGGRVFTMHPHQTAFCVSAEHLVPLPDKVPSRRAVLFPFVETALNAVWDADLEARESALVLGGGIIGLLVAWILHGRKGQPVPVLEPDPERREWIRALTGLVPVSASEAMAGEYDCAFHCSGQPTGLQLALDCLGFEGRVIELSWFGNQPVSVSLGGAFHYQRKQIRASQVASLAAPVRSKVTLRDRTNRVLDLLADAELDRLLGPEIAFHELPAFMQRLYAGERPGLTPVVTYS
ncbi:MAG: dehydrogenase [Verrucomicrobia bacterium]|jgi:threonine dehydrogenase-like Zn-dependent dehydrogenase|nr:dehydrogenase [Verrucomicrobiota bacterium]